MIMNMEVLDRTISTVRLPKIAIIDSLVGKPYRRFSKSILSHEVLDRHTRIAWDFDETLVDGPLSWFWRRWIRDNHNDHEFCIITFRSASQAAYIWDELSSCKDPLKKQWFTNVISVPSVLWNAYVSIPSELQDFDEPWKKTGLIDHVLEEYNLKSDDVVEINRAIRAWKATECIKQKCYVFVEDREEFCRPYCDALGIEFVNALTG
jgi:hypothetical protein